MKNTRLTFPEGYQSSGFFDEDEASETDALNHLLEKSDEIFIKRMALNDWEWSIKANKHQNGPLIPKGQRDSEFFPVKKLIPRPANKKAIYLAEFDIFWPQIAENLTASLRHFTSKNETHLTGVPKRLFENIAPASFVVIGKNKSYLAESYQAVVINSASEAAESLIDLFKISPAFISDFFKPAVAISSFEDRVLEFIEQALFAFKSGNFIEFSKQYASLPEPEEMARLAQKQYLNEHPDTKSFDPFFLCAPGDCLMEISRKIELDIFREHELRQRSLELVSVILGDGSKGINIDNVFRNIIKNFPRIDRVLLSASQTRKARAGRSFEFHIETMLQAGRVPHDVQAIMTAKRRPDFILPSLMVYRQSDRSYNQALVLSAKTTLRERWKQVEGEINNCDLYLATVDDKIAENAIQSMQAAGIKLVVPESLKNSITTVYKGQDNVISFRDFFDHDLKKVRYPHWKAMGLLN